MIPTLGGTGTGQTPHPRGAPAHASRQVLVLDEAIPVQRALLESLAKLGIPRDEIVVAATPEEALAAFRADPPRIVFAELVGARPEDGLEIVHEMLDRSPDTKIVLVTAEARDSPEVRAAVRAGVFAVVEKPLRSEKIRQVLQDLETEEGGIERYR